MLSTFHSLKKWAEYEKVHYTLSDKDVHDVQRLLLLIMDDIHDVCTENNLRYVITGGCAIGAVRHKGFIPWDDDIDICLLRKDYDRLPELINKAYPGKYTVQNINTSPDYDLNFMKIRLNGTRFVEPADNDRKNAGLFIDVFPIENVRKSRIGRLWQRFTSDGLQFICSCVRIKDKYQRMGAVIEADPELGRMLGKKKAIGTLFSFRSLRKWLLTTEKALSNCHNDKSDIIAIPAGRGHFGGEQYLRKWFMDPVLMQYEDRQYFFPKEIHKYLSHLYGNYMTIPDEADRERHTIIEYDISKYADMI